MARAGAPAVTVVVCSRNGARTIAACLEALEKQTLHDQSQVVVVDDGSTDATGAIARRYEVDLVVHEQNRGLGEARNTGIRLARGPIVAFTDDDCIPEPTWMEALVASYARPEVVGVGGPVGIARVETLVHRYLADHPPLAPLELELAWRDSLHERLAIYLKAMWSPERPSHGRAVYSFAGANMSFRREALEAVGMFDPAITFGSDDEHICGRIRDHYPDSLLWFAPEATVRHDYAGTLRDLLRRNHAYGRGHARMYLTDPTKRWPIVFPVPIAALAAGVALGRSRRLALVPLAVQVALPQGIVGAIRHRRGQDLAYSWLRFAEELAHDAGMAGGLVAGALKGPSRPRGAR